MKKVKKPQTEKNREIALKNPTNEHLERYKDSKIETNRTLRRRKRKEEKRKIEEIVNNIYNSKQLFSNSRDIKQEYKQLTRMVRSQAGDLRTNEKEVAEEFKNYHKVLSRRLKTLLYISYLRPIVTHACETWSTTKGDTKNWRYLKEKF